jgi:hypothetical protein
MEESVTYQEIVELGRAEGKLKEARKLIFLLDDRFVRSPPLRDPRSQALLGNARAGSSASSASLLAREAELRTHAFPSRAWERGNEERGLGNEDWRRTCEMVI